MPTLLPNLFKSRHGVYYLRLQRGGQDIKRSLRTKNLSDARAAAYAFNLALMRDRPRFSEYALTADDLSEIRRLDVVLPNGMQLNNIQTEEDRRFVRKLIDDAMLESIGPISDEQWARMQERDHQRKTLEAVAAVATAKPLSKILSVSVDLYLAEKEHDNSQKTIYDKRRSLNVFIEVVGDVDINSVTANTAVEFKNRLIGLRQSVIQINKQISYLKDLFNYAINNNLYFSANPFDKVRISKKSKLSTKVVHYDAFTDDELKTIFTEETYMRFFAKPDYRYLPFLALHTGARLEELASLRLDQIQTDGGVTYFNIRYGKNQNSVRKIPLHAAVMASTFPTYVQKQRDKGVEMLFDQLKPGKNGFGKNMSRRFGLYLTHIGITDKRKVFHSFRHTVVGNLTEMGVNAALIMAVVGHYEQDKVDFMAPHFKNYQHEKPLKVLEGVVNQLVYELPIKL